MVTVGTRKSLVKIKDEVDFYDHQLDGVRRMARMGSLLLADEMGLGKSLQALTVAAIDFEIGAASRVLIVSPATLKWNWQEEIDWATYFTYVVLDGDKREREAVLKSFDKDILVVNYEQVVTHLDALNACHFDIVICDEAHYIKNRRAKRTKAVHSLVAKRFLLLTGSPILNHVPDLWSLLHRIAPAEFPEYWRFVNRYAVFGGYQDKEIIGVKNTPELRSKVDPRMIRRKADGTLKLPPKIYVPILVDLYPEQRKLYDQARKDLKIELPENPEPMELENALVKFLRLKQICGTTATIPGYADISVKLDVTMERIFEMMDNDEHVVVFTQLREVQRCLNRRLGERDIPWFELHGDVPIKDRVPVIHQWSESSPAVLTAMLQVAGVGLNMTKAHKCIFVDKLFVPKLNEQAEDRLYRIGTTGDTVEIFAIIARNTIEQRVEAILRAKTKEFGEVVEESNWKRKLVKAIMEEEGM